MRIAYPMRADALDKPGGDLLQVSRYIESGKNPGKVGCLGFEGVIITDPGEDLSCFDLIHLTNIDRPVDSYRSFLDAKAARRPIIFSAIHHSYREIERYERMGRGGLAGQVSGLLGFTALEYLRNMVRSRHYPQLILPMVSMTGKGMRKCQREMLTGADQILVLTEKEKLDILADFGEIQESKFTYLRNGLDCAESEGEEGVSRDIDICMVGRVEARKNQVAVLKVLNRLGLSGVFVGALNKNHETYCHRFRSMVQDSGSTYIGSVSHEETLRLMRRSKVHVSASWFEVLSLVDLEAYCAGCGVVASDCGGTREILGSRACYVSPDSEESIEKGIKAMLDKTEGSMAIHSRERAREPISESWSEIGRRLAEIYNHHIQNDLALAKRTP